MHFHTMQFETAIITRDVADGPAARLVPMPLKIEIEIASMYRQEPAVIDRLRRMAVAQAVGNYRSTTIIANTDPALVEFMALADAGAIDLVIIDYAQLSFFAENIYKRTQNDMINFMENESRIGQWDGIPVEKQIYPYRVTVRSQDDSATFLRTAEA